ncbi:MAG: HAD family hydrolase [Pseudomonadota bacterium]
MDLTGWTVVFDLDGTLIDTAPDLIGTVQALLARRDLAPVPEALMRPQISFGSRRMMRLALAHHGQTPDDTELDAIFAEFLAHYREHLADESRPFPGIVEQMGRLGAAGARLAVCTNKAEAPARELLAALDMSKHFAFIAGRDTFPICKPDPGHLTRTIAEAGGDSARAIMVGDSETDVHTAKAASVPVIGVTFGYTSIPVTELDCDAVIESYETNAFEGAVRRLIRAEE